MPPVEGTTGSILRGGNCTITSLFHSVSSTFHAPFKGNRAAAYFCIEEKTLTCLFIPFPQSCREPLTNPVVASQPLSIYILYISVPDIYQMIEASRTLVLLDKGATAGSASMIPDSTAPPKQKSMELNQQAKGLTLETSRAPAQKQK